ncbi:MAG: DUF1801 domain-containing protein [Bacteroidota bacterium]
MAKLKTQPNDMNVSDLLDKVLPQNKREDCIKLVKLMQEVTEEKPVMWGESIVGFGNYHFKYESGKELDWMLSGFSPRNQNLTIYIVGGFENQEDLLERIGKVKKSVGCLYVKKLADIDLSILEKMIRRSVETVKKRYAEFN